MADGMAGSAPSSAISRSRASTASWDSTGRPSSSRTGTAITWPSSLTVSSCSVVGNERTRYSMTYSRGVRSIERSACSAGGSSARRRSSSASPVETSWTTGARPASRSASMALISVGHFMAASRWPKKRCLACSNADMAADLAPGESVSPFCVTPVASSAAWMFSWMIRNAPA